MKRRGWIIAGAGAAGVVLLLVGAGLSVYFYKKHQGRDIRGSSTIEFVPTQTAPVAKPPPKPKPGRPAALDRVDWPLFGYDLQRLRYLPSRLRPPFRTEWTFFGHHLLEFPPAVAYGRAYIANNPGVLYAVQTATGRASWRFETGRCTAASPAVADEVVYMAFLNLRRQGSDACNASPGTPGLDGLVVALDARSGKLRWRRVIGPSETSPLVGGGRVYGGDWTGTVFALEA
ncbi:MAG: PQQ-binding-like beta-propeller repeat protein, partial [Verrucomicrobiota bacterium]